MEAITKLKVIKTKWTIRFETGTEVAVKLGDEVKKDQLLASRTEYEEVSKSLWSCFPGVKTKDINSLKNCLVGMVIEEGRVIGGENGVMGKKVVSTVSGKIEKVDEFERIIIKKNNKKVHQYLAPCQSKVSSIEATSIVLEFRAEEWVGKSIKDGKCWGGGLKAVEKISDLSLNDNGKIILLSIFDGAILTKAEVVGVVGVIVLLSEVLESISDKINTNLPVLALERNDYDRLKSIKNFENRQGLLNVANGRLLLVI